MTASSRTTCCSRSGSAGTSRGSSTCTSGPRRSRHGSRPSRSPSRHDSRTRVAALVRRASRPRGAAWLAEQARGLHTYARVLAGEPLSYADEVEGSYGVRPAARAPRRSLEAAHARDRRVARRLGRPGRSGTSPGARVRAVTGRRVAGADRRRAPRRARARPRASSTCRTARRSTSGTCVTSPGRRSTTTSATLRSRVVVNTDLPMVLDARARDRRARGVPGAPRRAVAEGGAARPRRRGCSRRRSARSRHRRPSSRRGSRASPRRTRSTDEVRRRRRCRCSAGTGSSSTSSRPRARRAASPRSSTRPANVALLVHEHGLPQDDAVAYLERFGLRGEDYARQQVRFVTDPTWRAYISTYTAGCPALRRLRRGAPGRRASAACSPSRSRSASSSPSPAEPYPVGAPCGDPVADELPLGVGHPGHVAERHHPARPRPPRSSRPGRAISAGVSRTIPAGARGVPVLRRRDAHDRARSAAR